MNYTAKKKCFYPLDIKSKVSSSDLSVVNVSISHQYHLNGETAFQARVTFQGEQLICS